MNYYYTTGVTKDGFPIYKCIRGTSALEGYHRHLRALVAQGCISPRLLIALLRCFNYRWNVGRSVDNEDLPPFYSGWYSHWNVESSQDATANWFDEPVHSDWISTKESVSSGEIFYLISNGHDGDANDGAESDEDGLENTLEHQTWTAMLPPSLQWLARQEGAKIPTTRFATPQERDLFKDNYRRFRSSSKSQDSHDQWDFAAMLRWLSGGMRMSTSLKRSVVSRVVFFVRLGPFSGRFTKSDCASSILRPLLHKAVSQVLHSERSTSNYSKPSEMTVASLSWRERHAQKVHGGRVASTVCSIACVSRTSPPRYAGLY